MKILFITPSGDHQLIDSEIRPMVGESVIALHGGTYEVVMVTALYCAPANGAIKEACKQLNTIPQLVVAIR